MELKSLFLGILISVGIFSIKAGLGLNYCLGLGNRPGMRWRGCLGFAGLYWLLFVCIAAWLRHIDILGDFENIQQFLEGGMIIHFALACMMLAWGFALMKSQGGVHRRSLGRLALVLPCPVCMIVIGISLAFILAVFPDEATVAVLILSIAFVTISFLTAAFMGKHEKWFRRSPESMLGFAMISIAAYFLLSMLVVPQFSGLDEVYRIASNLGKDKSERMIWPAVGGCLVIFGAGYLSMRRRVQINLLSHSRR